MRGLADAFAAAVSVGLQHGAPLEAYVDALAHARFAPAGAVEGDPAIDRANSIPDYVVRSLAASYLGRVVPAEPGRCRAAEPEEPPLLPLDLPPARRRASLRVVALMGRVDARLAELGITLPSPMAPMANYVPFVRTGDLVVVSGQVPARDGKIAYTGKLGEGVSVETGQEAARLCFVNVLVHLKAACDGDLDRVTRVVRLGGFIASPARLQPARAGDERRLRPGRRGVRRGRAPRPLHHRRPGAARGRGGRGRGDVHAAAARNPPSSLREGAEAGCGRALAGSATLARPRGRHIIAHARRSPSLTLTLHPSIASIAPAEWDACAGDGNPFVSHAFLSAVEDSGSAGPRTGWLPQHAALRDEAGQLLAAAPMYAKSNSYGEYVFDHGWANAYEQAGGDYYPKLQVAVPFSPGARAAAAVPPGGGVPAEALGQALVQACERAEAVRRARHLLHRGGVGGAGPRRLAAAAGPAIPLGEPRLRHVRRLPGRAVVAQAQGAAAGAAGRQRLPAWSSAPCAAPRSGGASGMRSTASTSPPWTANGAAPT